MANNKIVVGLDIGRFCARAIWVEMRHDMPVVTRTESLRLPAGSPSTSKVMSSWIETLNIGKTPCVIGIPGQLAMFQPFQLPLDDPRTPEQAASMEVLKFNEIASETMSYSFSDFSIIPGEQRLLIVMARPAVINEALDLAKQLNLNIIEMLPAPVALFNAGEFCSGKHDAPFAYIDIGNSSTSVAVGSSNAIIFARAFAAGGQLFTDAIVNAKNISTSQAESLKTEKGTLLNTFEDVDLSSTAKLWLSELESCLSVYQSVFSDRKMKIGKIILTGGGSALKGLPEFVKSNLEIDTVVLESTPGKQAPDDPAGFAVGMGLALAGLNPKDAILSLLPTQIRYNLNLRLQKPFWVAAAITAAAILGVCLVCGSFQLKRMKTYQQELDAKLDKHQLLANQIDTIKNNSKQIREMATPVKKLLRAGPLVRDLTTLVLDSTAPGDWITMICDSEFYFSPPKEEVATNSKKVGMRSRRKRPVKKKLGPDESERFQRLIIQGYTHSLNLSSVRDLIAKLAATDYVESADTLSDDQTIAEGEIEGKRRDPTAQRFIIEAKVSTP